MSAASSEFPVLNVNLQVSFFFRLQDLRSRFLAEALRETVARIDLNLINNELAALVPPESLKATAVLGLRGEVVYAIPSLLLANPFLIGYYRLLLGFSQKEFYKGRYARFKIMEDRGLLPRDSQDLVSQLCRSLIASSVQLTGGIGIVSKDVVHDLQLLTLGPQLRGSENNSIGSKATLEVFSLLRELILPYLKEETKRTLVLENDSRRRVVIEFSNDPDIQVLEQLASTVRPLISIEIKGGRDISNKHNRIGEAEKSHQKARARGFFEFWTILRTEIDSSAARQESPTTSHFFQLNALKDSDSQEYAAFRDLLGSVLGIQMHNDV